MTERIVKDRTQRTRVITAGDPDRKSKAVQSEKHASNINNIVARAYKTGQLPLIMGRQHVENMPTALTYQEAMDQFVYANQQFQRLPSAIRQEFDNDPKKLLVALENPKEKGNFERLLKANVIEPVQKVVDPILEELRKLNSAQQSGEAASGGEATA